MTDRRVLLKGLAAAVLLPRRGWAAAGAPRYLAAAKRPEGSYVLHGIDADGALVFAVDLPARGHAAAAHPYRAEAVGFARRPGSFGIVLDCRSGDVIRRLTPPEGRQFNGHGAFSRDGALLYTSEVVAEGSAGRVGLWDARNGYARLGEWDSHGIGPHEIRCLPDGRIAIANGGIQTDPANRRKLNLDQMRPSLVLLDAQGGLLSQRVLPDALHQSSIRHLALLPDGVAFAMQWQGDPAEQVPLLGVAQSEAALATLDLREAEQGAMKGYAGSIAVSGEVIALTSPRGGCATLFATDRGHIATLRRADICGVAADGGRQGGFVFSDGGGALWRGSEQGLTLLQRYDLAWDNHLIRIGA